MTDGVWASGGEAERAGVERTELAIIGAGPCGLAAAIAAKRAGIDAVVFDRSCVVSGIASYPTYMTFFSTAERLSIGGVPFVVATEKPTRRDALAYYRTLVRHFGLTVRQYEPVMSVEPVGEGDAAGAVSAKAVEAAEAAGERGAGVEARERAGRGGPPPNTTMSRSAVGATTISSPPGTRRPPRFLLRSGTAEGRERLTLAHAVVIATGYFGRPNRLGVPGEELPHVTHRFHEGHEAFDRDAVVVGGGNSAVDAALELYRAGARVHLVHFGPSFDRNIKPWVLPDITNRVKEGSIQGHWSSRVRAIEPGWVVVDGPDGEERIPAQHVYLMIGYMPETQLLESLGVPLDPETGIPAHDPATMETVVPGVYIAGVLASGFDANKTFIENGRGHGELIVQSLLSE